MDANRVGDMMNDWHSLALSYSKQYLEIDWDQKPQGLALRRVTDSVQQLARRTLQGGTAKNVFSSIDVSI